MDVLLYVVVGLIIGAVAGYLIGAARGKGAGLSSDSRNFEAELAAANATIQGHQARIDELKAEIVARDAKAQQENQILQALAPVRQQLTDMQAKVNTMETQRVDQYAKLEKDILQSIDVTNKLNSQTRALATAMSDNRVRGKWGEIQLERIVEAAGMLNRVDFTTQTNTENESGSGIKPDLVIHLPGKRAIPVDSKVPFDAFLKAMELDDTTDPVQAVERKNLMDKHVADLRGHIKALGNKKYWEGFANSADYVIAFIPSENLLAAAMEHDPTLGEYALSNKVALATPMNLFSTLKTVALIWQNTTDQEALNHVIQLGKDLFSRLSVVADHAANVGKHLENSVKAYSKFVSSLERNLFTTAREINKQEVTQFGEYKIEEPKQIEATPTKFSKFEINETSTDLEGDSDELEQDK
ncbi:MAG: DNA recombination protein RmuC [Micrococcales bacterium]